MILTSTQPRATTACVKSAIGRSFQFLKDADTLVTALIKSIKVDETNSYLVPVSRLHCGTPEPSTAVGGIRADVAREIGHQMDGYLTSADVLWLQLVNAHGEAKGSLRLTRLEVDAPTLSVDQIRCDSDAVPLLAAAMRALQEWLRTTVGNVSLRIPQITTEKALAADGLTVEEDTTERAFVTNRVAAGSQMILTAGPSISQREAYYAWDAALNGWNSKWSSYLTAFERSFAGYVGTKHCLATSCCTGALHIALAALEIGPGDEVIVPDITWVATANAVRYVGATPVFADIEEDSWCLDPESFEQKITPRTKAVMPVHLYGHPARMDRIMEIARKHGLYVVEDAAPAIGSEWKGQRAGTFGDFGCFSFQGAKLLVTGEGGALVTSNPVLYEKALKVWDQGRDPKKVFWIDASGLKYKMSNVQAALGLAQIERCDEQIEMKRQIFGWYQEGLEGCRHISVLPEVPDARSIYWMSNCRLAPTAPIDRETLRTELKKRNVDTRPVFPAISQYPIWTSRQSPEPRALIVGNEGINLPSGVCLTRSHVDYVCRMIMQLLS